MSTFTINKATGEFVGARRSARLAAKRGDAVFTPRVERYSAAAAPVERRTSPRLAGYYAERAAAAERRESAFRLVREVLDFTNERAADLGKQASVKGFTIYYDPFTDTRACCACGGGACETEMQAELSETLTRFHADIVPRIKSADGTAASVEAVMVATYNHPDLPVLLRAAKVRASCKRFYDTLEAKMREYLAHPRATPTLRLVCGAILHQYYGM